VAAPDQTTRDRLVEQHMPLVRSLARRYARAGEPVEDLVQVGTIGLLKAIDRFDPSRGVHLRASAGPAIEGEIRHHLRAARARSSVPLGDADGPAARPDDGDDRALVAAGLKVLTGRERRVIEMRFQDDLRQVDIAEQLGISQAQVSRIIQRALARMREALDGEAPRAAAPARRENGTHSGRLLLRMDPALHSRLARAAERESTSLNAYITARLEQALEPPPAPRSRLLAANLVAVLVAIAAGAILVAGAIADVW
jgi:RNA polymerase sigma factor (sigma-70 family)